MAFGANGFGGFGSNNNSPSGSFGFGKPNGFEQQKPSIGFGSGSAGGNPFGSGASTFVQPNSTPFGGTASTNAFGTGSTTTGGIFGGNTATSTAPGFGGFGTVATNTTPAFGQPNNTSGGNLFGTKQSSFGSATTLFGTGNTTTSNAGGTFGGASTGGSLFGAAQGTALGAKTADCQGTGGTPFQAFSEKEANSTTTNHFQSISFMQPYVKYSFEELRLADYNQGRRYGNSSGQAGAFGQSTGFGNFGQSAQPAQTGGAFGTAGAPSGGGFGQAAAPSSTPFGSNTQTAGTFGGGSMFSPKPATGGLFGNTATQSAAPSFGTSGTTGFGQQAQQNTGGFGPGVSLFGAQNNQPKPGFSFGQNTATTTAAGGFATGGAFGGATTNNTAGGLFGNNAGQPQNPSVSLFGQNQTQAPAANPFGQPAQPQTQTPAFGGGFGAQNQAKPNLFGNSTPNTGGGLFGTPQNNQQQQPATGGLFGQNNNAGGNNPFGQKPAATAPALFGGNNNTNNNQAGGGLFSNLGNNNQAQQNNNNQGGLFGGNQLQQTAKPLFGNTGGGSLFGNPQQNQSTGSLFGNNNAGQGNAGNSNANSLFVGSQQNVLQPPQGLTASMNDPTPYGSSSLFFGLPQPTMENPGPIATPISSGQKQKKHAALPQYKLNPARASMLVTPQRMGYGFSYSTYGTPSSVTSVSSTPGLGSTLLGGSMGRSAFNKALSTSNLRRTYDSDGDSILAPGAFSANSSRYTGTGSLKRLTIDRSLRTDLFSSVAVGDFPSPERSDPLRTPSILKKKVSFDATTLGGDGNGAIASIANGHDTNGSATPSAQEQGYMRSRNGGRTNGSRSSLGADQPETDQVKGMELAIVHEDESPKDERPQPPQIVDFRDPQPGAYWIEPSIEQLKKMPRSELKAVSGVTIGRKNCGSCSFDRPVDLTTVDLDKIFDGIAVIAIRSITIYPSDYKKPPVGMGLNVPSTLRLENSWPRGRDNKTPTGEKFGPKVEKHIRRLARNKMTTFKGYDRDTGVWTFTVDHFTTYGLDYESDDEQNGNEMDMMQSSILSEAPPTPTPKSRSPRSRSSPLTPRENEQDTSMLTEDNTRVSSEPDDTFEFKRRPMFPGAFDDAPAFDDEDDDQEMTELRQNGESFLDERSVVSQSDNDDDEPSEFVEDAPSEDGSFEVEDEEMDIIGSFPAGKEEMFPRSILKTSQRAPYIGTPGKAFLAVTDNWTEQLQRTVSPKKQDREALRQSQARFFKVQEDDAPRSIQKPAKATPNGGEITTSIDLMNSLFGKEEARKSRQSPKKAEQKGFKWPYPKSKSSTQNEMTNRDRTFHDSFKPTWGPQEVLLHALDDAIVNRDSLVMTSVDTISSEDRNVQVSKFATSNDITPANFQKQRDQAQIKVLDNVPFATAAPWSFETGTKYPHATPANDHESLIWELTSILFDRHYDEVPADIPEELKPQFEKRIIKDRLSAFWSRICREEATMAVAAAGSAEERAIAYLSMHKIAEACNALIEGKDYRLATLVAQIGGDQTMHDGMGAQIDEWRKLNVLSEVSDPIRTLYELLAGNTCNSVGKKGPLEDRAKTFVIGERFGIGWKRAFGLKLWYAILTDDPLETAVQEFISDLADNETKKPVPWYIEDEGLPRQWDDAHSSKREDVLWGLLKLYADKSGKASTLSEVVSPENATGNPLSTRLSFELYHTLAPHFPSHTSTGGDQLTVSFAAELSAASSWLWSLFALLRLSNPQQRQRALQSTLSNHAASIDETDPALLATLFDTFHIPPAWVWEAKALHARSVARDHVAETRFLLRAKNYAEAHVTLCDVVAPQAVVERSYGELKELLKGFETKPTDWRTGGQVYEDYLALIDGEKSSPGVSRLLRVLGELAEKGENRPFLQKVAVQEIGAVVGERVLRDAGSDAKEQAWVLQLPLTGETKRVRAAELSWGYYRKMMAMGG